MLPTCRCAASINSQCHTNTRTGSIVCMRHWMLLLLQPRTQRKVHGPNHEPSERSTPVCRPDLKENSSLDQTRPNRQDRFHHRVLPQKSSGNTAAPRRACRSRRTPTTQKGQGEKDICMDIIGRDQETSVYIDRARPLAADQSHPPPLLLLSSPPWTDRLRLICIAVAVPPSLAHPGRSRSRVSLSPSVRY